MNALPAVQRATEAYPLPPHSIEAEQALLGSLMLDNDSWCRITAHIKDSDFYNDSHQIIFQAISELSQKNEPFDAVTLSEHLQRQGKLEDAGGMAYLAEMTRDTPTAENICAYAGIVSERSLRRQLITAGEELAREAFNPGSKTAMQIVAGFQKQFAKDNKRFSSGGLVAVDACELVGMQLPAREPLLGQWLTLQGLVMVHAWRGIGKTHFSLGTAYAVASGSSFLGWEAKTPHRVLYLDGEMPGAALQERVSRHVISDPKEPAPGFLRFATPDLQHGAMPDLATQDGQQQIEPLLDGVDLIVVDNLSCLARRGGKENEGESWLPVADWALSQRSQGRAVLFVHHSGKGGAQRGTSRREDMLDVVISLRRPQDYVATEGARFIVAFEKARGLSGDAVKEFEASLTVDTADRQVWTTRGCADTELHRLAQLVKEGANRRELAEELDLSRFAVKRRIETAIAAGLITRSDLKDSREKD